MENVTLLVCERRPAAVLMRRIIMSSNMASFIANYVDGLRQFRKVKVDMWLSLLFFTEKINGYEKNQNEHFNICMHHGPV